MNFYSLSGELLIVDNDTNKAIKFIRDKYFDYVSHLSLIEYSKNNYSCIFKSSFVFHITVSDMSTGIKYKDWYIILPDREGNELHDDIIRMDDENKKYVFDNMFIYRVEDDSIEKVIKDTNHHTVSCISTIMSILDGGIFGLNTDNINLAFSSYAYISGEYYGVYDVDGNDLMAEDKFINYDIETVPTHVYDEIPDLPETISLYEYKTDITNPKKNTRYYVDYSMTDSPITDAMDKFIDKYEIWNDAPRNEYKRVCIASYNISNSDTIDDVINKIYIDKDIVEGLDMLNIKEFISMVISYSYKEYKHNELYISIENDFKVTIDRTEKTPLMELSRLHMNRDVYSIENITLDYSKK